MCVPEWQTRLQALARHRGLFNTEQECTDLGGQVQRTATEDDPALPARRFQGGGGALVDLAFADARQLLRRNRARGVRSAVMDGAGEGTERLEHGLCVLVLQRPEDESQGALLQDSRERAGQRAGRVGVVGAVHVDVPEPLQPRRPGRGLEAGLGVAGLAQPARFQQRAGQRGIGALVVPGEAGLRAHGPARPRIAEGAVVPALELVIASRAPERKTELVGPDLQHLGGRARLPGAHRGSAGLEDPGLLGGHVRKRRPQVLGVLSPRALTAQARGLTTLVASRRPPSPTSITIASTSRKARNAISVTISKNVSPGSPSAQGTPERTSSSSSHARSSEMGTPSRRMRSQKWFRWGLL